MKSTIDALKLNSYRQCTFRLRPDLILKTKEDAIEFVNERGFVLFWPIKGIEYPSLWSAVAGERPVPSNHDDPGHITWGWKDELLDQRRWYYGKIIRGKATMISLDLAPFFYALSENYGEPESDYLQQYYDGNLSQPAKMIYEALLDEGASDTIQLKRKIHMTSKSSKSVFDRTLVELQRDFKILPVGVSDSGAWRYSFIYDLVHRYYPDVPQKARQISIEDARARLAIHYFKSLGASSMKELKRFFSSSKRELEHTLDSLVESGELVAVLHGKEEKEEYYSLPELTSG